MPRTVGFCRVRRLAMYRSHSLASDESLPPPNDLPRPATDPPPRKTARFQTGLRVRISILILISHSAHSDP